jgi:hypothetical protein
MSATANTTEKSPANRWLFNPWIDLLGLGGLSIIAGVAMALLGMRGEPSQTWRDWLFFGSFFVNFPHYAATYYRVYPQPSQIRKYALESVWAPVWLAVLCAVCLLFRAALFPWLILFYLAYSGYHYSGQNYGISLIFFNKLGYKLTGWQKALMAAPIYLFYGFASLYSNRTGQKPLELFHVGLPSLGLPEGLAYAVLALAGVSLTGFACWLVMHQRTLQKPFPWAVGMLMLSHALWFGLAAWYPLFWLMVPFFHCLQYLLITSYCDYKDQPPHAGDAAVSSMRYLGSLRFLRYYVFQIIGGALLFVGLPLTLSLLSGFRLDSMAAVVAIYINLHHFVLDGAIWKLRKPEVAKVLSVEPVEAHSNAA